MRSRFLLVMFIIMTSLTETSSFLRSGSVSSRQGRRMHRRGLPPRLYRARRNPTGFALAYLQKAIDAEDASEEEQSVPKEQIRSVDGKRRRDEVLSDGRCLARCNRELGVGMDMVDAHSAFGSIDVPSVMSARDLELFCALDSRHSQCIDDCGYSVQFNLREYVCKRKRLQMLDYIPCYRMTAPFLTRYCRPRCGRYRPLEHSAPGYGARCRQLLCDHACADYLLRRVCGVEEGKAAADFLLHFTRIQVDFWISDYARVSQSSDTRTFYPPSCARLHCDGFQTSGNCTLEPAESLRLIRRQ